MRAAWSSSLLALLPLVLCSPPALGQVPVPTTQVAAGEHHQVVVTWRRERLDVQVLDLGGRPVDLRGVSGRAGVHAARTTSGGPDAQERVGVLRAASRQGEPAHLELEQHLGELPAQGLVRVRIELTRDGAAERFVVVWRDGAPVHGACLMGGDPARGPHGGLLVADGGLVHEVVYTYDRVRVWTFDASGEPLAPGPRGTANLRVERAGGTFQERMARLRPVRAEGAVGYLEARHALGGGERIVIRVHLAGDRGASEFELVLRGWTPSWSWSCPRRCEGGPMLEPGTCRACGAVLRR